MSVCLVSLVSLVGLVYSVCLVGLFSCFKTPKHLIYNVAFHLKVKDKSKNHKRQDHSISFFAIL